VVIVGGGFGGLACARKLAGELDEGCCWIECPRHGSRLDPRTGRPLSLPACLPVEVFPVEVRDDVVTVELD
jgi:3-phenylpropionate/trans-cinnamate dioxygenase ferredoxin component